MTNCNHPRLRCTDNTFYCLDCGAMVQRPDFTPLAREPTEPTETTTPTEAKSPPRRQAAAKGGKKQ